MACSPKWTIKNGSVDEIKVNISLNKTMDTAEDKNNQMSTVSHRSPAASKTKTKAKSVPSQNGKKALKIGLRKVVDMSSSKSEALKCDQTEDKKSNNYSEHSTQRYTIIKEPNETAHLLPVVNILEKYDFKYEVMPDIQRKNNNIFFQDKLMNAFFKYYPEYICIDVLCEIPGLERHLCLFISADANGYCEIVSVGLIKSDNSGFSWLCEVFKKHNPNWRKICVITSDKSLFNMEAIKQSFADKIVLVSFFHSLKALKRDLSNLDDKISDQDINKTVQIFERMIFASDESEYSELLKQLKTLPSSVAILFRKKWHPKRDLWAVGFHLKSRMFLKSFNNYLVYIRKKIRPVISSEISVENIIKKLSSFLSKFRKDRFQNFTAVFHNALVPAQQKQIACHKYSKFLTRYAAEVVAEQMDDAVSIKSVQRLSCGRYTCSSDILVMTNTCSCDFYGLISLPCCHIFALRKYLSVSLFDSSLCAARWTAISYRHTYVDLQSTYLVEEKLEHSSCQRFQRCFDLFGDLWSLLLESSDNISRERIKVFQNLLYSWQTGLRLNVKASEKSNNPSKSNNVSLEDMPADYWKEIYGISLKDVFDSENDFSSLSFCSENSNELL